MNHDIGIHALHPQSSPLMATLAFALALNQHIPDTYILCTCYTVKHPQNYYNDITPPKYRNAIKPRISVLCPEGHKQITRYYYHHTISSSIKFNLNPPAISCAKHLAPQSPQIAFSLGGWVGIITIALSCAQRGLRRTSEESCLP